MDGTSPPPTIHVLIDWVEVGLDNRWKDHWHWQVIDRMMIGDGSEKTYEEAVDAAYEFLAEHDHRVIMVPHHTYTALATLAQEDREPCLSRWAVRPKG